MSHLVHMCSFDMLPTILNEAKIDRRGFISFTEGMPLFLGHGDTAIVFNKQKLIDKGYDLRQIEYNKDFLNKNPEIKNHVFEYKTEEELCDDLVGIIDFKIKKMKNLAQKDLINKEMLESLEIVKKSMYEDPVGYFLKATSYENEVIIKNPFIFDIHDIDGIIHSSKTFYKYYPLPAIYNKKVVFIEDFHEPEYMFLSPLADWMIQKENEIDSYKELGIIADLYIPKLYQFVYSLILHPEWRLYAKYKIKPPVILPSKWDKIFRQMDLIEDITLKIEAIDYVFRSYILEYGLHIKTPESEKLIIQSISEI